MTMKAAHKNVMERLSKKLSREIGIHFSDEHLSEMERLLLPVAHKLGHDSVATMAEEALEAHWGPAELEIFAQCLTIGETFFFREDHFWKYLQSTLLPELLQKNGSEPLAIWSAACCTGEEAYTAAIIADRVMGNASAQSVKIFGSDINNNFLQRARQGRYSAWSLRSTSEEILGDYFVAESNHSYLIKETLKNKVQFFEHNLVDIDAQIPASWPAFDLILLRNVLMYFDQNQTEAVVDKLCSRLKAGGWLCVSPQDLWRLPREKYQRYENRSIFMLRKKASAPVNRTPVEISATDLKLPPLTKSTTAARASVPQSSTSPVASVANAELLEEEVDEARSRALQSDTSIGALLESIHQLSSGGDLLSALTWTESAIDLHPIEEALYYIKANILQELGANAQAILALKQAIFLKSDFVMAHFCMFNLLSQSGKPDQAIKHLDNAILALEKFLPTQIVPYSDHLSAGEFLQITRLMRP